MVNPNRFYTYAYLRKNRTPYYIGKGTGRRLYSTNRKGLKPPKDKSRIILLKQNITEEEAFKHEIYMIAVFGRKDLGTGILHNKTNGGEGITGIVFTEEHKEKISRALQGITRSEETRRKLSEAHRGEKHHNYGKTRSKEIRRKMSEGRKGKYAGENSFWYGRTLSEEHRRNVSNAKKGKSSPSEETKRKMSEANKDKKWWNDGCGNTKFSEKSPGENWIAGRGKIKKIK
jgi:hypothetical protein